MNHIPEFLAEWYYLPKIFERGAQDRGGYSLKQDYSNMLIRYSHFHTVFTKSKASPWKLETITPFDEILASQAEIALAKFYSFLRTEGLPFIDICEICIRILWYPAQSVTTDRLHCDECFATVPLFDSHAHIGIPFWGNMAPHLLDVQPKPHYFQAVLEEPRIYMAAFLQADPSIKSRTHPDYTLGEILKRRLKQELEPYKDVA